MHRPYVSTPGMQLVADDPLQTVFIVWLQEVLAALDTEVELPRRVSQWILAGHSMVKTIAACMQPWAPPVYVPVPTCPYLRG